MIPHKIHYCWFGNNPIPQLAEECLTSWRNHMPDWEYRFWNESNFDVDGTPYTKEAYANGNYAFVSDYVRLWALENEGGVYLDVDFEVYKPFNDLLHHHAFAGFEGSKHLPVMMGVCASEAHGEWVTKMKNSYHDRHFLNSDGTPNLTTNVQFITSLMVANGFRQDGTEQDYLDLHIFPVDYFSPRLTTGEYLRTNNTYCEHKGLGSWNSHTDKWKETIKKIVGNKNMTRLIKAKRHLEKTINCNYK